jgi:hypothetical protein
MSHGSASGKSKCALSRSAGRRQRRGKGRRKRETALSLPIVLCRLLPGQSPCCTSGSNASGAQSPAAAHEPFPKCHLRGEKAERRPSEGNLLESGTVLDILTKDSVRDCKGLDRRCSPSLDLDRRSLAAGEFLSGFLLCHGIATRAWRHRSNDLMQLSNHPMTKEMTNNPTNSSVRVSACFGFLWCMNRR